MNHTTIEISFDYTEHGQLHELYRALNDLFNTYRDEEGTDFKYFTKTQYSL